MRQTAIERMNDPEADGDRQEIQAELDKAREAVETLNDFNDEVSTH